MCGRRETGMGVLPPLAPGGCIERGQTPSQEPRGPTRSPTKPPCPRTTSITARSLSLTALPLTLAENPSAPARALLPAEVVATKLGGRRAGECRARRAAGGGEGRSAGGGGGSRAARPCAETRARSRRAELDGSSPLLLSPPSPPAVLLDLRSPPDVRLGSVCGATRSASSTRSPEARGAPPAAPRVSPSQPGGGVGVWGVGEDSG